MFSSSCSQPGEQLVYNTVIKICWQYIRCLGRGKLVQLFWNHLHRSLCRYFLLEKEEEKFQQSFKILKENFSQVCHYVDVVLFKETSWWNHSWRWSEMSFISCDTQPWPWGIRSCSCAVQEWLIHEPAGDVMAMAPQPCKSSDKSCFSSMTLHLWQFPLAGPSFFPEVSHIVFLWGHDHQPQ